MKTIGLKAIKNFYFLKNSTTYFSHFCKDTEPLYHSFMYSLVSLLSDIYPLPAMHSLLVTQFVLIFHRFLPYCVQQFIFFILPPR